MVQFAKRKTSLTLAILLAGVPLVAPSLLTRAQGTEKPRWHFLYEVDVDVAVQERLELARDAVRDVLRMDKVGYAGLAVSNNAVIAQLTDPSTRDKVLTLLTDAAAGMLVDVDAAGSVRIEFTEPQLVQLRRQVIEQSIEIVRRRIDEVGVKEPTIVRQGEDRIIVQLPGVGDPKRLKELIGKTAKVTFQFVDSTVASPVPDKPVIIPSGSVAYQSRDGGWEIVKKRVILTGENLVDARSGHHPTTGESVVYFEFDTGGAKRFGRATADNVGRRFAIVLDGEVISAPVINEPIPSGKGYIRGRFTADSAHDLALLLRAGALPAPLILLEERTE